MIAVFLSKVSNMPKKMKRKKLKNKIISAIILIAMIAAVGTTAIISMNGNAFAQSEQFTQSNGLCVEGHTCTCTSGVFHDITTGFSINTGCINSRG
jgi:flagellar basal body-associated protein FliL